MKKSLSKAVTLSILAAFCGGMFYTTEVQAKNVLRLRHDFYDGGQSVWVDRSGLGSNIEYWTKQSSDDFYSYVIKLIDTSGVNKKSVNDHNEIIVEVDGAFDAEIYGAYTDSNEAPVCNNVVSIHRIDYNQEDNDVKEVKRNIFGGYSNNNTSDVYNNEVRIGDIKVGGSVYGGSAEHTKANNNIILLERVAIDGSVYGGKGGKSANGNEIVILDSTVQGKTYGGYSNGNEANGNILEIHNIKAANSIYGGYSEQGKANENSVNIEKGEVEWDVYGGYSNDTGDAESNIVNIAADVNGFVYGGYSRSGEAKNNIVNFSSGSAYYLIGGNTQKGSAKNNIVNMSGGSADSIYGGWLFNNSETSNSDDKEISGNKVTISGGYVGGMIAGGYLHTMHSDDVLKANDNVVELSGTADVSNASLYGYFASVGSKENVKIDGVSNNQLIINNWKGKTDGSGNTVGKLANFNSIKIVDTANVKLFAKEKSDLSNTTIYLQSLGSDQAVGNGTTLTVDMKNIIFDKNKIRFFDDAKGNPTNQGYTYSDNGDNGVRVYELEFKDQPYINRDTIFANGNVKKSILTGVYIDKASDKHYNSEKEGLTIDGELSTNAKIISGSYAKAGNTASNGVITISGKPNTSYFKYANKTIYAGYAEQGSVNNNSIILEHNADVSDWNLHGYNSTFGSNNINGSGNKLVFKDWNALNNEQKVNSVNNFAELKFNNIGFDKVFTANEKSDLIGAKIIIGDTSNNGYVDVGAAIADGVDYAVDDKIEKNILTLKNIQINKDYVTLNIKNNKGKTEKIDDKGVGVRVHEIALLNAEGESQKDVPWSVKPNVKINGETATIAFDGQITKSIYTNSYSTKHGTDSATYAPVKGLFAIDENFKTNANIISGSYAKRDSTAADDDNNAGSGLISIKGNVNKNQFANGDIYGGYAERGTAENNLVILEADANVNGDVTIYGGYSEDGAVKNNSIILGEGVTLSGYIYAGYSENTGIAESVANNSVIIKSDVDISKLNLYGYNKTFKEDSTNNEKTINGGNNKLIIDGWNGKVNEIANFSQIEFQNLDNQKIISDISSKLGNAKIVITGINFASDATKADAADIAKFNAVNDDKEHKAGDYAVDDKNREAKLILENFTLQDAEGGAAKLKTSNGAIDNIEFNGEQINDKFAGGGVRVHQFNFTNEQVDKKLSDDGKPVIEITVSGTIEKSIYANKYVDSKGGLHTGAGDFVINEDFKTNANIIAGAYIVDRSIEQIAEEAGNITISGNVDVNNFKYAEGNVYAGYAERGKVQNNSITVEKGADISDLNLYGYNKTFPGKDSISVDITGENNKLILNGWTGKVNSLNNFNVIEFNNIAQNSAINSTAISNLNNTKIVIKGMDIDNGNGDYAVSANLTHEAILKLNNFTSTNGTVDVQYDGEQINDTFADGGVRVHHFDFSDESEVVQDDNVITIKAVGNIAKSIYTNRYIDRAGKLYTGAKDFVVDENFKTNASIIAGSYGAIGEGVIERAATKGNITIKGDVDVSKFANAGGKIYAGYVEQDEINGENSTAYRNVSDNSITLDGANAGAVNLYGYNSDGDDIRGSNNSVIVTGGASKIGSINNFSDISFKNIAWQDGDTVLNIIGENGKERSLANTNINLEGISFKGGENFKAGESMQLIAGNNLGLDANKIQGNTSFSAGVALVGKGTAEVNDKGLTYTITEKRVNSQVDIVAESRALSAALINQGGDIIADGIASLTQDTNYGTKTFAAVYGNRSKYDAISDAKINGWSGIFGVGSEKKIAEGDLSWGVFFEKGNGDYHVNNKFGDEYFRSDGSLKYNGGGIMARMEQDNDVYYEASLRAGKIESEMTNALKESGGASYGYESESTYYGAHLGVGKVITIDSEQELDVYGKYFHSYTEGDSFTVAGDKFEFDSVTSDRVQIGARLTTNKNNKWSTYYGLAYEYEFNGDAKMKAAGMNAPTQSLQGSTLIGEIGLHFAENKKSPWSMDAKLRGYAGEREGFSGNIQVNYSF